MRRLLSALTITAATSAFLVVPLVARPAATPHAVAAQVTTVPVAPVSGGSGARGVLAQVSRPHTPGFELVGATWRTGAVDPGTTRLQVRVHQDGGWSGWQDLGANDGGADGDTPDAVRAARVHDGTQVAEPVWVGASDGVEARVVDDRPGVATPDQDGVQLVLVDGGTSAADSDPTPVATIGGAVADAAVDEPTIYTRKDWGADESLRRSACPAGPDYAPTIKMGFVHHTDSPNDYSRADVPGIIRGIYAYHVQANGWCDVGYNFLVDRFGRIWEGRAGGIDRPVIGAHTGGFNYDSFAASLIGTFNSTKPSTAMVHAVEQLFAWKLGRAYRDPIGHSTLTAGAFSGSRYAEGRDVRFRTVSGHRDADYTTCPGTAAYGDLGDIRTAIKARMGAGFVAPSVSATEARMALGSFVVHAGAIAAESWRLKALDATGNVVATVSGSADRSNDVVATWNLTDDAGAPVAPGPYTLRLTATGSGGQAAVPWHTDVTVTPPVSLVVPSRTSYDDQVVAHGLGIPGHSVDVSVATPRGALDVGTFHVAKDGTWASTAVTARRDVAWTVSDPAIADWSRTRTTYVAPVLAAPAPVAPRFVAAGAQVRLSGSALPGAASPVAVMSRPLGATTWAKGKTASVASDGTWSLAVAPTAPVVVRVTDARGRSTHPVTVYPVADPTARAPSDGYAGRTVHVVGNAGHAPVPATLSLRTAGGDWSEVRTVTAATDGHVRLGLKLPGNTEGVVSWRLVNGYGAPARGAVTVHPVFAPTVSGPAAAPWNHQQSLTGTAVPGDVVTVETAPAGTKDWSVRGRTTAGSDTTWILPVAFLRDTRWRVSSRSGRSVAGLTMIVPTLHAPASVTARTTPTVLHGRAIPGHTVRLWRAPAGTTTWVEVTSVVVGSDGRWSLTRHPRRSMTYRVTSHHQDSRSMTVSVQ